MNILLDVTKIPLDKVNQIALQYDLDLVFFKEKAFLWVGEIIYHNNSLVKNHIILFNNNIK